MSEGTTELKRKFLALPDSVTAWVSSDNICNKNTIWILFLSTFALCLYLPIWKHIGTSPQNIIQRKSTVMSECVSKVITTVIWKMMDKSEVQGDRNAEWGRDSSKTQEFLSTNA